MRHIGLLGRALAVTVTAGMALGLVGCGDEGSSGPVHASKENAVEVEQSAVLSKDDILKATTTAAVKAGSAHMSMTMSLGEKESTSMQGDVSYAGGGTTMQATMSMPQMGSSKMELRYVGNVVYMQIPGMTPAGKFVAIDPKDQSSPMAKSFAGLSEQMDPMASMRSMQSSVTSAKRVGEERVQGVAVDHYRVVVDTTRMVAKLGKAGQQVQAQMPKTIPYDFWLDEDDLIRRMSFDLLGTNTEIEMSDWGKPVTVQRPAAGDVVKTPSAPGA